MSDLAGRFDISPYPTDHSVSRSLDWVVDHLGDFRPFDEAGLYSPKRTKPFNELALMFGVYAAAGGNTDSSAGLAIGEFLRAVSDRADYTDWALRFPAELVNYAELYAALQEYGYEAEELRHRVQRAVDSGAPWQFERLPHRLLELRAALDWAGVTHSLPSIADLSAQTILGGPVSADVLPTSSIYAATHVIFFSSRFGLDQAAIPEWLQSASVRSLLCDLLVVTSQVRNWDLLGELLLCWDCLGFAHDLVTEAGWASFREAFLPDGAVLPHLRATENGSRAVDFGLVYHTTLVAVLAGMVFHRRVRHNRDPGR